LTDLALFKNNPLISAGKTRESMNDKSKSEGVPNINGALK
jgi:hypothetical protein